MGHPSISVRLDDGTGTFPHNITAYVDLQAEIRVEAGRQDELGEVDVGELTLTLETEDSRFTLGDPTYGVHTDQRIRVAYIVDGVSRRRFTGYVQDWPQQWESPTAGLVRVTIKAVDRLAPAERHKLRSMLEEEILRDRPAAYFTLGEPEGSTSAGDTSGTGQRAATLSGNGAAIAFGTGTGPGTDGLSAAMFAGGQYVFARLRHPTGTPGPVSIECFFRREGLPADRERILHLRAPDGATLAWVDILTDGRIEAIFNAYTGYVLGGNLADGATHHVVLWCDGATLGVGLDGGHVTQPAGPVQPFGYLEMGRGFTGTLSHVAVYTDGLGMGRYIDHASAGLNGFDGERSDLRVKRLAAYDGLGAGDLDLEVGAAQLVPQSTSGASVADAWRAAATAEGGSVFVNADGEVVFHSARHRVLAATGAPAITLAAEYVDHDNLRVSGDKQYLQNVISGRRPNGAAQTVTAQESVDVPGRGEYPHDFGELLLPTDGQVLARLNWHRRTYSEPKPRLSSVTLDLLTLPSATVKTLQALEQGDYIKITDLPDQSAIDPAELIVEGWVETLDAGSWSMQLNTVSADLFRAWILGDPVYGVLGTTTIPHH